MGLKTDLALGWIAFVAFGAAFVLRGVPLSIPFLVLGSAGTIAFEIVAFRHDEVVRRYWERRRVQLGSLIVAFGLAGLGAAIAPEPLLSAGIGALVTYLCFGIAVLCSRHI